MQSTLTSFEIAAIILELKDRLSGARIKNIYQTRGKTLILRLHRPNDANLSLLIESGKRLHLTSYILEKPQQPPAFCMALRKHLRNGIINDISQFEFERILTISVATRVGEFKLIVEIFGDGNIILVDPHNLIQQALRFKKMRDRNVMRGELYQHAPTRGKNPFTAEVSTLLQLRSFKELEIVKGLTKLLSISGKYAEEILLDAEVNKREKCELMEDQDFNRIIAALKSLLTHLKMEKLEPCIILDENGAWIDVVPIQLKKYESFTCKTSATFNEAVDDYYARALGEEKLTVIAREDEQDIAKQRRILGEQQEMLASARKTREIMKRAGDAIYSHFNEIQAFLERIMKDKRDGRTWKEIISQIERDKESRKIPSLYFRSLEAKKLIVKLEIGDLPLSLSLRKSAQENAATFYKEAKKAQRKAVGAEKAIQETTHRIEKLGQQHEVRLQKPVKPLDKTRKKAWYEKFRWFFSSENLLVVGGKDAITNEILIRKHVEPDDLIFHADLAGAPFVVLKTKSQTPSQESIFESAQLAASHSRGWKAKYSALDVYWVHPSQVSKTPPTGEYIPKGAFVIRGKKNYVRKTPLQLVIGIDLNTKPLTIVGGPMQAIKTKTKDYVEINPGDTKSSKLAGEIRNMLKRLVPRDLQEEVSRIPLAEIQAFIPFGKGAVGTSKDRAGEKNRTHRRKRGKKKSK
ncbi:MAG: ribosome rescue protein RqcH [Candidatus Bathyarchaeota archaeon]|nr:ribosome rescue protein RqcH [Candidatus Bathyarchaeota archaeon]